MNEITYNGKTYPSFRKIYFTRGVFRKPKKPNKTDAYTWDGRPAKRWL